MAVATHTKRRHHLDATDKTLCLPALPVFPLHQHRTLAAAQPHLAVLNGGLQLHAALGLVSGAKCGMPTVNTLEQLQSQARRFNCLPFMHKTRRQRPVLWCVGFVTLWRGEYARAFADFCNGCSHGAESHHF